MHLAKNMLISSSSYDETTEADVVQRSCAELIAAVRASLDPFEIIMVSYEKESLRV